MSIMPNAKRALATATVAAALLSMAACGSNNAASDKSDSSGAASSGKIEIVTSIDQWGSVAEDLGGSNVEVTNIMIKTNIEAHGYEPTSQGVAKSSTAKIAVVDGADYDSWATRAAQPTKTTLVTAVETTSIKEGDNPHARFSAKVHSSTADTIIATYQKADPSHKDDYAKPNKEWYAKENQLESKIEETSARTEGLSYTATESVAWHPTDDLKMIDVTPKGYAWASVSESEPTPVDIKDFQDILKAGFIKILISNSQEANSITDQITGATRGANVPIVKLAGQMPKQYTNLLGWMSALADQSAATVE